RRRRAFYAGGALLCAFAVLFTASRGVYIAFALAVLIYFVASGRVAVTRVRALAVFALFAVIIATSPGIRQTMSTYFLGLFEQKERSIKGRLTDYDNVLRQFDKTPAAGSGPATWE